MEAPSIVVSEKLATREAQNVVFVSPEEVLNIRQPAYTKSTTEIAWLLRQPSAASIMVNQPYIQLEIEFTLAQDGGNAVTADHAPTFKHKRAAAKSAYGMEFECFPFQSKCCRASVFTVNGASQTYRNTEICQQYLRANTNREFMKRNGNEWNEYAQSFVKQDGQLSAADVKKQEVASFSEASRKRKFDHNMMGYAMTDVTVPVGGVTKTLYYREPLFLSVFGGLMSNSEFPLWSCEGNKSPTLLHMNQVQISMTLLDNWYQNLFGLIQNDKNHALIVQNAVIKTANLCCTFVSPPPKYVSSALSSQVSYACMKALRFKMNPTQPGKVAPNEMKTFTMNATSFSYMPSCFMISVEPDYNEKLNYIAAGNALSTDAVDTNILDRLYESKMDKRWLIHKLNLVVNTSPDVFPAIGNAGVEDAKRHQLTYNARQLYEFYKENTSQEKCLYDFDTWRRDACCVIITSEQMSGILASSSIKGNVTISGSIECVNTMGYACYVGDASENALDGDYWIGTKKLEKYNAQIVGVYSNQFMSIDSKSAIIGESTLSEQFGSSLRLS